MNSEFQPFRLAQARRIRRLTLEGVAEKVGLTKQAIGNFERGDRTPTPINLRALSRALNFPSAFFLKPRGPIEAARKSVEHYRSLRKIRAVAMERERAVALAELCAALFDDLSTYLDIHPPILQPGADLEQDFLDIHNQQVEDAARDLRKDWGLGDGPISNLCLLVENHSLPVFATSLKHGMDGLSLWQGGVPIIMVSSAANVFRSRMNVAHELGHLVMHQGVDSDLFEDKERFKVIEDQAWRFGGAFLMPQASFLSEVYSISLDGLLVLKERWKVSIAAIIQRLRQLEIIDQRKVQSLFVQLSQRSWRKNEPLDEEFAPENPQWFSHAVSAVCEGYSIELAEFASDTRLPIWFLAEVLKVSEDRLLGLDRADRTNVVKFKMRG